mgnify:CR=1 FL=1
MEAGDYFHIDGPTGLSLEQLELAIRDLNISNVMSFILFIVVASSFQSG